MKYLLFIDDSSTYAAAVCDAVECKTCYYMTSHMLAVQPAEG